MGIQGNKAFPAEMLSENIETAIDIFNQATIDKRKRRVVNFGSTCAYSPSVQAPFMPTEYMQGDPEPTNYGYAMAKRTIYAMSVVYGDQYGMDNLYLVLPNLYGPGCRFTGSMHVVPDMIVKVQKAIDSGASQVAFLGTGKPEREFLFIEDAVKLILKAIEECHTHLPVNITSGELISIKALAALICETMGYEGEIVFDQKSPDGQLVRCLAKGVHLDHPTTLREGILETVNYFRSKQVTTAGGRNG